MHRPSPTDITETASPLPLDADDVQGKLAARLRAGGDATFLEGVLRISQSAPESAVGLLDLVPVDTELAGIAGLIRRDLALRLDATRAMARHAAIEALPEADRPGGAHDQARAQAFARDPGRWLPGAARAPRFFRAPPPGFGFVTFMGLVHPWTYVCEAYATSDVSELVSWAEDAGLHRGVGVGTRATGDRLVAEGLLPPGYCWASVDLGGPAPVLPFRGRAA